MSQHQLHYLLQELLTIFGVLGQLQIQYWLRQHLIQAIVLLEHRFMVVHHQKAHL